MQPSRGVIRKGVLNMCSKFIEGPAMRKYDFNEVDILL